MPARQSPLHSPPRNSQSRPYPSLELPLLKVLGFCSNHWLCFDCIWSIELKVRREVAQIRFEVSRLRNHASIFARTGVCRSRSSLTFPTLFSFCSSQRFTYKSLVPFFASILYLSIVINVIFLVTADGAEILCSLAKSWDDQNLNFSSHNATRDRSHQCISILTGSYEWSPSLHTRAIPAGINRVENSLTPEPLRQNDTRDLHSVHVGFSLVNNRERGFCSTMAICNLQLVVTHINAQDVVLTQFHDLPKSRRNLAIITYASPSQLVLPAPYRPSPFWIATVISVRISCTCSQHM